MAQQLPIRVKLNAGLPTVSQIGADRVHIFNGEVAFGPTSIIGKSTRIIFTDAELLTFSTRIQAYLQQKGIADASVHPPGEAVQGVHPPGTSG